MFNIEFWSFTKAPNSTAQPTGTSTVFKCVSNEDFNIIEPRIPLQLGPANNPTTYNYAKISVFSRYYWVTRWAFEGGMWVAYMRVDALASWKSQIGGLSAYVLRAAADYNGDIIDTLYPRTAKTVFDNDSITTPWSIYQSSGTYIVGIKGNGGVKYYAFSWALFNLFFRQLLSSDYVTQALGVYAITNQDMATQVNPLQYVSSVIWLPYTAATGTTVSHLWVGNVDVPYVDNLGVNAYANISTDGYDYKTYDFTLAKHPLTASRGNFVNASMAEYKLTVPGFGTFTLDPLLLSDAEKITIGITVDQRTGAAVLKVWAFTTGEGLHTLMRVTGSIGIPIQMSSVVTNGMALSSIIQPAISGLGSLMSIPMAAMSQNAGGMISGMGGVFGAAGSYLGDAAQTKIPAVNTVGGTPCISNLLDDIRIDYCWYYPVDDDLTDRGRPLCEKRTLSTLSGYQLCADVEVQIPCTRDEEQMIKGHLESGYFYE